MASTTSCDWREQTIRYNVVCRSRNNFEREVANLLTHSRIRNQQKPLLLRVTIRGPSKTPKPPLARHRRQPPARSFLISTLGGESAPFAFNGSSPSFPAQATQPASAGVFPFGNQTAPSMSVQSKEKAFQNEVHNGDHSKEDVSQIEPPRENFPKEETPQTAPSMTVKSNEKASEDRVPNDDHSKADMSQIEPPSEYFPKEETPQKDTLVLNPLKDELPQEKDLKTGKPRAPKNSTSPSPRPRRPLIAKSKRPRKRRQRLGLRKHRRRSAWRWL